MKLVPAQEPAPLDHHATALAHITKVVADLDDAHAVILQLRADLHREQDRCVMLLEERDRYRHAELRMRKLVIKQSVKMINAALILEEAKDTIHEIDDMDEQPTPPTEAIDKLEAELTKGNADCHITTPNAGRG